MAAQYDLEIYQGSDFSIQFQLKDAAGQPLDLSSATVASQIRDYAGALIASFTVTTQVLGAVSLSLSRAITSTLTPNHYKYNAILRLNNFDEPVLEGSVIIRPQITVLL